MDEVAEMDILSRLYERNILEAVEKICSHSGFQSVVKMQYVSKTWLSIVEQTDAWQQLLLHDYNNCAKFRRTCDVMRWTPLLFKRKTPQPGQLKYLSFITQYISTKQNL